MPDVATMFDAPATKIPRDRFQRPLVVPPDGGKPTAYTRATTFVDCLDDKYNLQRWQLRQTAVGLSERADLLLSVSAHRDDKRALDQIVDQAMEAARSSAASTTGTALHALCERSDRGQQIGVIPDSARRDLDAYRAATHGMNHLYIERFSVHDALKIGGTPDRVSRWDDGEHYIADIKTGADISWGAMKIAMQLAVYAHSVPYNASTGQREPYAFPVNKERAIVIHLPAGEARCELHFVDIGLGWEAVHTAAQVRGYRSHKQWYTPIDSPPPPAATTLSVVAAGIAAAKTLNELYAMFSPEWTEEELALARARREELEGVA
jgi:hypothetical protein